MITSKILTGFITFYRFFVWRFYFYAQRFFSSVANCTSNDILIYKR